MMPGEHKMKTKIVQQFVCVIASTQDNLIQSSHPKLCFAKGSVIARHEKGSGGGGDFSQC